MDLSTGYPFWPAKNGVIRTYNPLDVSLSADVAVIGGGITGALLTRALVKAGLDCVVLDARNIGWGSTSASTALLQYEIDTHLSDLCGMIGEEPALLAYRSCHEALQKAEDLCRALGGGDFAMRKSLYFASKPDDVCPLKAEFQLRRRHGFEVEWLDAPAIGALFDLKAEAAILSRAAQVDSYQLVHAVLRDAEARGTKIFARTEVREIEEKERRVLVHTTRGPSLDCRHVVVACGYESLSFLRQSPPIDLNSSYALVSEPLLSREGWPDECQFWETARPYHYARTTSDGRGILGGADLPFRNPAARDAALPRQIGLLEKQWEAMFPRIPLEIAFRWTGTFAETGDGLPFIGFPSSQPRTFFALCYGGNGIVFSLIAAEMAVDAFRGRRHPCAELFGFEGRS